MGIRWPSLIFRAYLISFDLLSVVERTFRALFVGLARCVEYEVKPSKVTIFGKVYVGG